MKLEGSAIPLPVSALEKAAEKLDWAVKTRLLITEGHRTKASGKENPWGKTKSNVIGCTNAMR